MSTPRTLVLDERVRRADTATERGTFATLRVSSEKTALPHGHCLFVPGWTGSKEDFAALLPLLGRAGWDVATYDQRGQYETNADPEDDFSLAGFAADARAVGHAMFGATERIHLVGHSFGGLVAATAAIEQPETWASLTLMCSGPGGIPGDGSELLDNAERIRSGGLEAAYDAKVARDRRLGRPAPTPEIEAWLHQRFLANTPESLAAITRLLAQAPDRTADLAGVGIKTVVMRGEDDDAWPHDTQDALAKALGTSTVVIKDAAHSPAVEQPEQTRDALARIWLR